jgi:hypothetical protein
MRFMFTSVSLYSVNINFKFLALIEKNISITPPKFLILFQKLANICEHKFIECLYVYTGSPRDDIISFTCW